MTNRVSLQALEKEIFTERVKMLYCMAVPTVPSRRLAAQASLQHGIKRHCNVFPLPVSFRGRHQMIRPSGRHIWLHYKERNEDILNHAFPCGNNSYRVFPIDR